MNFKIFGESLSRERREALTLAGVRYLVDTDERLYSSIHSSIVRRFGAESADVVKLLAT